MLFSVQPEDVLSAGEICPEVLSECVKIVSPPETILAGA